jgi:RimJ/RimL family protein N-acetyltransferase
LEIEVGGFMTLDSKIKTVKRKINSIGFYPTVKLIISNLVRLLFYRNYILFYVDIPKYSIRPNQFCENVTAQEIESFDELSIEDVISIKDYGGENYIIKMKERFANNWILFLAHIDKKVAAGVWIIFNSSEFKTKNKPLFDKDVAIIDGWTIPAYRGKRVFPFLLSFMINQLKNKNLERAFLEVNERNLASIKASKRGGFKVYSS